MPVYNGEDYLAEAIDSILAQTLTDFELLIVDDGSRDNSAEIIRSYQKRDSRIRFFRHEGNLGQAAAQNTGIAAAEGALLAAMDSDDISLPQRLEKQVAFLQANPEIGLVGVRQRFVDKDLNPLTSYKLPRSHAIIVLNLFIGASLHGPTIMIRREFLTEVGGFRPEARRCQDMELFLRLLQKTQIRFANLPDELYIYRLHDSQKSYFAKDSFQVSKDADCVAHRDNALEYLWSEPPEPAVSDRFFRLRAGQKLNWAERRAAKRDITRLIKSILKHNWVKPNDSRLLYDAMNRRLEQVSPRLWQQFCHWRRHHFGPPASQLDSA